MQTNQPNSIKDNFFRVTAVIITLCYVLGPAQLQVKSILHTISHNLVPPSYVLQHNEVDNKNYKNELSSVSSSSLNHSHEVIDFIDMIFDGQSDKNHRGESTTIDIKINKHITSNKYAFEFRNTTKMSAPNFGVTNVFYKKAYLDQLFKPPKA